MSKIFIISAPSGAGKSSLLNAFLETPLGKSKFSVAVSHTTRTPRPGETHGKEYYFTTISDFESLLDDNVFLEYAKVFKNYYGTSIKEIDTILAAGKNIILEIDWQGAQQTRAIYKDKATSLFIMPPSLDELRHRLVSRNTDSDDVIEYRMTQAKDEISHLNEYEDNIVNDDFEIALQELSNYFEKNINN